MANNKEVKFKGSVVRNVYKSDDFKTYAMDVDSTLYPYIQKNKYNNVSICGDIPLLTNGVEYEIVAVEKQTKYGISYDVKHIKRNIPTSAGDTLIFLQEILTSNQAVAVYNAYPDIVDRVMNDRLDDIDLSKVSGVGEKTFDKIKNKIIDNFMLAELVAEFKGVLSLSMVKKIYDEYTSIDIVRRKLRTEPYSCLTKISGIGFKTADDIIIKLQEENIINFGYDVKTSADRCLACVLHLLQENENDGHTRDNLADIRSKCYRLVPECADHFIEVVKDDSIYYEKDTMSIALKYTYVTERYIAKNIVNAVVQNNNVWDFDIDKYREVEGFELSDEQMAAIDNVCKYSVSILNGFAGSGKSFTTKALINMLDDNYLSYKIFAPTGKASKVISEYTHRTATTIHRGLGYTPCDGWRYNTENKLGTDICIIDEFSMCDIHLFRRVIDAIDFENTKLLLIGDNAQLPSVSCGNLLHDFLESGLIPTATLTNIFRYGEGGLMRVATDTRCCHQYLTNSMKNKETSFGSNQDYTFIDLRSEDISNRAVSLYKQLLKEGNSVDSIQVLTAKNVGECGTVELNNAIQKVANRNYGSEICMKFGDTTYYKGDLVLEKVNNYNAELAYHEFDSFESPQTAFVANGETGVIEEICKDYIIINFDGISVKYYRSDLTMIGLGYSMTIHKSQGSGIENVILCTPSSHVFMLNSNLIYVGLTRTKKRCFHLGSVNNVNSAISKKENLSRHTFMQQLLFEIYDNYL